MKAGTMMAGTRMEAWRWRGAWYVVGAAGVAHGCRHREGAVDWLHGYEGAPPAPSRVHDDDEAADAAKGVAPAWLEAILAHEGGGGTTGAAGS